MYCIIKDRKTFVAKPACSGVAVEYDLTYASIYDEVSHITLTGYKKPPDEGDFLWLENGYVGVIKSIDDPSDEQINIKCRQVITLFERQQYLGSRSLPALPLENRLKTMIDDEYTHQSDVMYRLPYLDVVTSGATQIDIQPTTDGGFFTIKSYLLKLRRLAKIYAKYTVKRNRLCVEIRPYDPGTHTVILPSAEYELVTSRVTDTKVGKVTVVHEPTGDQCNYYLLDNGNITGQYQTTDRVAGEWVYITVDNDDDPVLAVQEVIRCNSYSHNITFRSRERLEWGAALKIVLHNKLYDGYIAAVRYSSADDYYTYQSGDIDLHYPPLRRL